jgi:predicted component of type VI protein secretion system
MKHLIVSVEGDDTPKTIRDFVDNYLLARDSRALREYMKDIQPDIDLETTITVNGEEREMEVPIGINFFFPDA